MAPKKKFARVDAASRFRTVALRTVWTSLVFGVGFAVGRVSPENLLSRFGQPDDAGARASVGVEVPVVPREVYTVDNEMVRRRDEARAAASSGAAAPTTLGSADSPVGTAAEPTPSPAGDPAVDSPGIGVTAQEPGGAPSEPRVVIRAAAPEPVAEPIPPRPSRAETPTPRPELNAQPAATAAEGAAEPRIVRRTVGSAEGTHPFELEVSQPTGESAARTGRERLAAAGLDAHVVPSSDGQFRVVIRGRAGAEEQERQRRLAERVLSGEL